MNKFTTGFVVGNLVGMTGLMLRGNKKTRRSMEKSTKAFASKVGQIVEDIMDIL